MPITQFFLCLYQLWKTHHFLCSWGSATRHRTGNVKASIRDSEAKWKVIQSMEKTLFFVSCQNVKMTSRQHVLSFSLVFDSLRKRGPELQLVMGFKLFDLCPRKHALVSLAFKRTDWQKTNVSVNENVNHLNLVKALGAPGSSRGIHCNNSRQRKLPFTTIFKTPQTLVALTLSLPAYHCTVNDQM